MISKGQSPILALSIWPIAYLTYEHAEQCGTLEVWKHPNVQANLDLGIILLYIS